MKTLIAIIFSLLLIKASACTCTEPTIDNAYKNSAAVFYARCIGSDTIYSFHTEFGDPVVVNNFQVIQAYKGFGRGAMDYHQRRKRSYIISIVREGDCGQGCRICFKTGSNYLLYCYRDFLTGQLTTDGCARTQIVPDSTSFAEEFKTLENYYIADQKDYAFPKIAADFKNVERILKETLLEKEKELHHAKHSLLYSWIISGGLAIAVLVLILALKSRPIK